MENMISIIIPVYNVEKYIDECFQSILQQEHQCFEVIVVDDGSTDHSGEICDRYQAQDSRFQVIHTPNQGTGKARNLALDHMGGEYCFFLDPDDVLEPDSLSYLLNLIQTKNADLALGQRKTFVGNFLNAKCEDIIWDNDYLGRTDIIEKILFDASELKPIHEKGSPSSLEYGFTSALYRTAHLHQYDIRFLHIAYGEDTYVCFKYLFTANRVATTSKVVYWYRRNPTSTTFRYHADFLQGIKKYYELYRGLFEEFAPDYLEKGVEGLDGQYFNRCISAIEREIFLGVKTRSIREMYQVLSEIAGDSHFSEMYSSAKDTIRSKHIRRAAQMVRYRLSWLLAVGVKMLWRVKCITKGK